MKLVLLGGGGFRVPLVHRALLEDALASSVDRGEPLIDRLVLYDVDAQALAVMAAVLEQRTQAFGGAIVGPVIETSTDFDAALGGADFVFSAIRVGGLAGRVADERVALELGVLGQETVGAGGISYALRTLPVAMRIARRMAEIVPDAWLVNFTNPAGIVTEAVSEVLGDRVIGICDSPAGLIRRALKASGLAGGASVRVDYAGLNHLGWLTGMTTPDGDQLPDLLADPPRLTGFEEGRLFGAEWLSALGSIPNEYLDYYYRPRETVAAIRSAASTRGETLLREVGDFYRQATKGPARAAEAWARAHAGREETYMAENRAAAGAGPRSAEDRQGGGYEGVALALMRSLAGARRAGDETEPIVNVANRGTLRCLDDRAVVEVPCTVDEDGARPTRVQALTLHQQSLVSAVKASEREAIDAVRSGSADSARRAFAYHPLIGSASLADELLAGYRRAFPDLDALLR